MNDNVDDVHALTY